MAPVETMVVRLNDTAQVDTIVAKFNEMGQGETMLVKFIPIKEHSFRYFIRQLALLAVCVLAGPFVLFTLFVIGVTICSYIKAMASLVIFRRKDYLTQLQRRKENNDQIREQEWERAQMQKEVCQTANEKGWMEDQVEFVLNQVC